MREAIAAVAAIARSERGVLVLGNIIDCIICTVYNASVFKFFRQVMDGRCYATSSVWYQASGKVAYNTQTDDLITVPIDDRSKLR
jgi:hypothetical protein